jgi:hypothetical protein
MLRSRSASGMWVSTSASSCGGSREKLENCNRSQRYSVGRGVCAFV